MVTIQCHNSNIAAGVPKMGPRRHQLAANKAERSLKGLRSAL
jgi:hypothetical protein